MCPAPLNSCEQLAQVKNSSFFFLNPTGRKAPHSRSYCLSSNFTPSFIFSCLSFASWANCSNSSLASCSLKNLSLSSLSHSSRASSSKRSNFSHANSPLPFSQLASKVISPSSSTSKLCHRPQPPNFREQLIAPLIKIFSGISQLKIVYFVLLMLFKLSNVCFSCRRIDPFFLNTDLVKISV